MKNEPLNLNDLIKSLNDNIRDMLSLTNYHFAADVLHKNLKESVISAIRNTIYIKSDSEKIIEELIVTPESMINLSRYINLDEVLYIGSKYLYKICIDDNEEILILNLTGFSNHFPDFAITNLSYFYSVYNIGISGLMEHIKSYDKYLYNMLNYNHRSNNIDIKPILKDNTWEDIIWASENDCIPSTWKIGDEIDLVLNGKYNETITLQIWEFNHFDKTDGTGKAGILFGMKNLMKDKQRMNYSNNNMYTWNSSYMKNVVMKDIYESIPENIRNHIKEVYTYAANGNISTDISRGLLSKDKVFIPGLSEIYNEWEKQNKTETGQKRFPIFSNSVSRIKKLNNGTDGTEWWWTRSPYYGFSNGFCSFNDDGGSYGSIANISRGVCFCFNI